MFISPDSSFRRHSHARAAYEVFADAQASQYLGIIEATLARIAARRA